MRVIIYCGIAALMIGMVSCKSLQKNKSASDTAGVAGMEKMIVEKYWKLTHLFGEAIVTPEGGKDAFLILKQENNRVNGNTGCNAMSGTYTLQAGNKIRFSQMVTTRMMCLNITTETKFNQALEKADNFVVNGDILLINDANKQPLARFEAVYLR